MESLKKSLIAGSLLLIFAILILCRFIPSMHQVRGNSQNQDGIVTPGKTANLENMYGNSPQLKEHTSARMGASDSAASVANHPAKLVENGLTFDQAISKAIALNGNTDRRIMDLWMTAATVCDDNFDPEGSLNAAKIDNSRHWAIVRLVELCEGFDPKKYVLDKNGPPSPVNALIKSGANVAASIANDSVVSSQTIGDMHEAGMVLMETGKLDVEAILPGASQQYGPADLVPAWAMASRLVLCDEAGGCGANSVFTAQYCASFGCQQGTNFRDAVNQNMSSTQLRAVNAFYAYISARRKR